MDLPAHGALINQEFTLINCLKVIKQALEQHCLSTQVSVVGCSFGALVAIDYLAAHESAFKKVILLSCCSKTYSVFDIISPS